MGLFDSIAGNVLGSVLGGNKDGGSNPLGSILGAVMSGAGNHQEATSALGGILNAAGGIGGLMQKAQSMGLGDVVGSWVGKGANQAISGDQVTQLLGSDAVGGIASKFGIDMAQAAPLIASMLPVIIDKLTPHGEVTEEAHSGDALQSALGGLLGGGGLSSILGAVMGGNKPA